MRRFITIIIPLCLLAIMASLVPVAAAQDAIDTRIDAVLVIDNSGSMQDNDPRDMRISAAKLFVNLGAKGDQIGLVSMGDAQSTQAMMSLSEIDGFTQFAWDRFNAIEAPNELSNWTYMGSALALSDQVLESAANKNPQRAVLLLTDGLPTATDADKASEEQKLKNAVAKLKQEGVKIFPIALGPNADVNFLQNELATPTNGLVRRAESADQLLGVYIEIMTLLQEGRYVDSYDVTGEVDTFLAEVNPRQLIDQINFMFPAVNGQAPEVQNLILPSTPTSSLDKLLRFQDPNWSMWLARPEYVPRFNGEWRVTLDTDQPIVPVIAVIKSDLRTRLIEPIASVPDDDTTVRYYPAGRPLLIRAGARNQSDTFERRLGLFAQMVTPEEWPGFELIDGGERHDLLPEDGQSAGLYEQPMQPGNYQLKVNLSATDEHVQLARRYELIVEPLPTMQVEVEPDGILPVGEPVQIRVKWALDNQPADMVGAEIQAAVQRDGKTIETIALAPGEEGVWEGQYMPAQSGAYSFALTAHAEWESPDRGARIYTDYDVVEYDVSKQPLVEVSVDDAADRVNSLRDGIQRTVAFRSFSDQPVELKVDVAGVPGGQVFPQTLRIGPRETGNRTVTVTSPNSLESRDWQAQLKLEGTPDVRLSTTELPIRFTVNGWLVRNMWWIVPMFLLVLLLALLPSLRNRIRDFATRNLELLRYGGR
ncbi:MAG: VWA domain-containing protein [Chloroflexi bacterium]|nr:VWA domain-containing protein [Chloroflexota bacterium]